MENFLYTQLAFLHGHVLMIRNRTGQGLQNPNEIITHNMLQFSTANSSTVLNNIRNVMEDINGWNEEI